MPDACVLFGAGPAGFSPPPLEKIQAKMPTRLRPAISMITLRRQ
jgi:hypothetical protein